MTCVRFVSLCLPLGLPLLLTAAHAAPPPAAAYAALPAAATVRMAPDGKHIALVSSSDTMLAISVSSLDDDHVVQVPTAPWIPGRLLWKDSGTLLSSIEQTGTMPDGIPFSTNRLIALKSDGSALKPVIFDDISEEPGGSESIMLGGGDYYIQNVQDDIVSVLPAQDGHILMQALPADAREPYPNVYDVDLWGTRKRQVENTYADVVRWFADSHGVVRAGITRSEGSFSNGLYSSQILARASKDDDWHKLPVRAEDIAFSPTDPNVIYVQAYDPNRLLQMNIADGSSSVIADGNVDMVTNATAMVGYATLLADRSVAMTYTDPGWARDQASISKALHINNPVLTDRSDDGMRATSLIAIGGHPATLYLLDRTVKPANLSPLLSDYPDVPDNQVAPEKWLSFKARDGLTIPVLVTLPVNAPAGPIPFVVMPHGGPSDNDDGGFDYIAQFLASRGWGVLQPQFRGSTGYGDAFEKAGFKQWGLAMQDDVTDATKWAVAQGLADAKRICIFGASYGGYASLEGAEKEPSLYRCAAAFAPVTDLPLLIRESRDNAFGDGNIPSLGDDTQQLNATSPDQHADLIQVPVLLIHGRKDYTVPAEHTERMEKALQKAGKTETTLYLPDATHYAPFVADRLAILNALETFLKANLQ